MLFCILMTLVTIGHFSFVLFLHNWFYSKPFPRLLGDLIQGTHILFGIIGLFWVYTVAQKIETFFANPDPIFLSDLLLGYGLFCLFVGSIILPINEFDLLQEAHSIRNITPEILSASDDRYRRYILTINDWSDRNDNDYSYVKNVIYEYLGSSSFETRKRLMKYIDTEIMMMINMCRIDEMGV